ncbi:MAG: DUF2793 domain-containing protein [Rhizobiaceae bacterium]|nr:DUF2793 domain-containing protein [Rhizobiaceae bacterium]
MTDATANLALPYLLAAQAQKHVTHNEGLQRLDALVQLVIVDTLTLPPANADEGACYWTTAPATGDWSGREGSLAFRQDGSWIFITPRPGWSAFDLQRGRLVVFSEGAWHDLPLPVDAAVETLGVNTAADGYNRLAVAADATLFSHAGHGHQVKINKAAAADTASLLFQSGWQGRAEMGLAGSDAFAIKVSPDGGTWTTALAISPAGVVEMSGRPAVRASLATSTFTPADGSHTGFDDLHVAQGGFALGPALGSGYGHALTVPATGIYQVSIGAALLSSSGHEIALTVNGTTGISTIHGPALSSGTFQSAMVVTWLSAGDELSFRHGGSAELRFGYGGTELSAVMI